MKAALLSLLCLTATGLSAQSQWTKHEGNPVMDVGPPGSWDDSRIVWPNVVFEDSTYKMWYTSFKESQRHTSIGHATSADGLNWTKHPSNPVITFDDSSGWESSAVNPYVIKHREIYKMWYFGFNFNGKIETGYATSQDGLVWARWPQPVLTAGDAGAWDEAIADVGSVIIENDSTYKMWYFGLGNTSDLNWAIGYATSKDGINWIKHGHNPIMRTGEAGAWDNASVIGPKVVFRNGLHHMFYPSDSPVGGRIGYASSPDGLNWTKHPMNPVLQVGGPGEWDSRTTGTPSFLFDGTTFHLWYSGHQGDRQNRLGYASAPLDAPTSVGSDELQPQSFSLAQNYPNPFNPSTTIRYTLPSPAQLTLKIFNLRGQEVITLVENYLPAGGFETTWHADDLPSGLYFYRLSVGEGVSKKFQLTRKMMLIE